jgi:dihydrofolate synthase / folylpolyglutamate synthase
MHQSISSSYQSALDFLLSRIDYERATMVPYHRREFHLDRMHDLLGRLDNPHLALKVVHIAGTKGKGSTAAMTAAMLSAAGYRTGLYTSPHLDRVEERLMIDGCPCTPEQFVALVDRLRPVVEAIDDEGTGVDARVRDGFFGPTYFEITTAMAFLHFAEERTEVAVVEVGLGGRLDSTNVVRPLVSVITSISFDHMKQLGSTLDAIAREKAGIIKPGVPVVSGVLAEEARRAIEEVSRERGSTISQLGVDFDFVYRPPHELESAAALGEIDFRFLPDGGWPGLDRREAPVRGPTGASAAPPAAATPSHRDLLGVLNSDGLCGNLELALLGRHQASNAAVALATIAELRRQGWNVPESAVRRGLAETRCPARVEVVSRRPTIVIDTAHNLASIHSLVETLDESFSARRRLLLFAATQEKQVREMLETLLPRFDHVILTRYWNNPRAMPLEHLAELAATVSSVPQEVVPTPSEAWRRIRQLTTPEHLVCVTGSFFLAAEIRAQIGAENGSLGFDS